MVSARVYSRTGELLLVSDRSILAKVRHVDAKPYLDAVYPDWATVIVTREVRPSAGMDVDAIWENLVSIHHRDGEKRVYGT